jgi:hypothetical protein
MAAQLTFSPDPVVLPWDPSGTFYEFEKLIMTKYPFKGYVSTATGNYNYFLVDTSAITIPKVPLTLPSSLLIDQGVGTIETTSFTPSDFMIKGCEMPEPVLIPLEI